MKYFIFILTFVLFTQLYSSIPENANISNSNYVVLEVEDDYIVVIIDGKEIHIPVEK